jgi:hypothetical protein
LAAWIRNEEVNLNELRANSMVQRFESETKRNVASIFSKGYPRQWPVPGRDLFRLHVHCYEDLRARRNAPWQALHLKSFRPNRLWDAIGEWENRLLTLNSGLAMFIAPIGIWVGTPATFSSVFVPLPI